ncbi:ABC transporter substrate-binding protein [Streptomyces griseoincarnatus]
MAAEQDSVETVARRQIDQVNEQAGPDAVPVGIITPLSGPGDATAGSLVVRGACLGVEYVLRHGKLPLGKGIRLVVQNDQNGADTEGMQRSAVGGLAKLAMVDEVVAALGQWHLRTTPHVASTAELLGLPIFIENGHSAVTAEQRRMVFRTYFSVADRVPLMLDFLAAQGMRRVGLVAANTVFGLETADTLEQYGAGLGMEFLRFDFDQETTFDVREQLAAIRDFGPDVLINDAVVRTNYMVVEQAAEVGLRPKVPMMVTFGFPMRSADFWRLAGDNGNGIMWPSSRYRPSWDGLTEIGRWFTQRYTDLYGTFPPDTALSAFTDVTLIAKALDLAGEATREALVQALETHEFETWRGPVSFPRGEEHWHHCPPELVLMQYQKVGQSFDDAAIVAPDALSTHTYLTPEQLG